MSERDYWRDYEGRPSGFWATYPVTKAVCIGLAAIHVLITLATSADRTLVNPILDLFALSTEGTVRDLRVWQLLTCALLHGGVMHLVWNVLGIFIFGRIIEQRLGARKFIRFLIGAQLTASLAFLFLAALQDTYVPMIGASGIDFGVLILAAFWYPRMQIMMFFVVAAPLWLVAALWVFIETMMLFERGGGVAHSAHLGGALYGFIYYRFVGEFDQLFAFVHDWRRKRQQRQLEHDRRVREELRGEVERILGEVNREGMAALTDEEKRALKDASARLRR